MFMGHLHKDMTNKTGNVIYKSGAAFIEEDDAYYVITVKNNSEVKCELKKLK